MIEHAELMAVATINNPLCSCAEAIVALPNGRMPPTLPGHVRPSMWNNQQQPISREKTIRNIKKRSRIPQFHNETHPSSPVPPSLPSAYRFILTGQNTVISCW
jgi:hypothetical protein